MQNYFINKASYLFEIKKNNELLYETFQNNDSNFFLVELYFDLNL